MEYEELKEVSGQILDFINDAIDPLQTRIENLNAIHDFIKYDDNLMKKYGAMIGERFGMINVYTKTVDEVTLHINDVMEDMYLDYPPTSIGSLIFYWDKQLYTSILEIETLVSELESYMTYFKEVEEDEPEESKTVKPTVH